MINFEVARTLITAVTGKEPPKQIDAVKEAYNIYVINNGDLITENKNMDNLVWYADLSGTFKSRRDLFDDVRKELEAENIIMTEDDFKKIDKETNLSRFDYPSAFHLVCKNIRNNAE